MIRDGYMIVLADYSTCEGGKVRLYVYEINFNKNYDTT